ncbi:oxidoreductase [Sphaerisporangium rufum]|uniref:nitric oxide dioxygenase n=1 Tax=Sphaerisporangium rufum TaxID=1381558 RepID=A0A919QWL5_9ACTN|nr:globin domain-containing protein [Sphaerisporangium rufum]GII75228.1 oxidoreductase [Sphaerisporangium rufum]
MPVDIAVIRQSWNVVAPVADRIGVHFYAKLFADHPQLREMFPPAMNAQRDRLLHALTQVVLNLEDGPGLTEYLGQLARDHRKYGVLPEHYPAVGRCLVHAMRAEVGPAWRAVYDAAWIDAYRFVADVMVHAAEQEAAHTPAVWPAVVVGHEMRGRELVVVTVEPRERYPYRAGQYATLQTPVWPKVWRQYSIANAPRPDNRLTFHVRVVPGGWVSTALAHHTRPGDTVLLGPPRGAMLLDRASTRHLVFIAGGTGLAPLKAMVEESMWLPERPNIDLFHGVRRHTDAYDLPDLMALRSAHRRLRVVKAVSDDPADPRRERVIDAVQNHRVTLDGDVYVCGSPDMVRVTVGQLRGLGVPPRMIHTEYDPGGAAAPLVHTA